MSLEQEVVTALEFKCMDQDTQQGFFVDYAVLTPFGPMPTKAGPFATRKEADDFIEEQKRQHKQMLVRAEVRNA
jgi:hypothetical protein